MEIRAADGRASDLKDDIAVFEGTGLGDFSYGGVGSSVREKRADRGVKELVVLTDFDAVLAHPDQGLHLLAGRVCVLLTVATGIGHILLGHRIVAMAEYFLDQVGCLCHYSHVDGVRLL